MPFAEGFGDIKFPEITFPEFPSFELPDFGNIFAGLFDFLKPPIEDISEKEFELNGKEGMFGMDTMFDPSTGIITGETPPVVDLGVSPAGLAPLGEISFNQLKSQVFDTLVNLGLTSGEAFGKLRDIDFDMGAGFKALDVVLQGFNLPFTGAAAEKPTDEGTPTSVISQLPTSQQFEIGGVNVSGLPIFGVVAETPVTTLTQVLDLFPQLTASQAADFLAQFKGISPSEALLQDPDIKNISGDPMQPITILPASQPSLTGLTPQAIFKLLFPNVISNF